MPNITMSVHGNAFCSQQLVSNYFPVSEGGYSAISIPDQGEPWGWGRTFRQTGWYHVALPNIIAFENQPMYVHEVLIKKETRNMRFNEVHMWQGGEFFWTGRPSGEDVFHLLFWPRNSSGQRMSARAGLGISLHFEKENLDGYVTFMSALVVIQSTP